MKRVLIPGLVGLLVSCAPAQPPAATIALYPPVPPPMTDIQPKPPVSYRPLAWQPGHYDWSGSSYRWVPGRYIDRSLAAQGMWQPGFWSLVNGAWVWLPAHWS